MEPSWHGFRAGTGPLRPEPGQCLVSVMDLDTGDARRNYDFAPLLMCRFVVGGTGEFGFDQRSAFIRFCNRESEPFRSAGRVQTFQNSVKFCDV